MRFPIQSAILACTALLAAILKLHLTWPLPTTPALESAAASPSQSRPYRPQPSLPLLVVRHDPAEGGESVERGPQLNRIPTTSRKYRSVIGPRPDVASLEPAQK
jgi:hypothetical protein